MMNPSRPISERGFDLEVNRETFEERQILLKYKGGNNIALTLHFVQPQEYIEVFRGLKFELDTVIVKRGALCKDLNG